ncbi:MAG TPA: hypothetical protein VGR71_11645 [Nitrospira sp.]|nr:hypothetical protein [Nitrospira sp.]
MKRYFVTAKYPQALAKNTFQSTTVQATQIPHAAKLALKELMKRDGIKGLRHKQIVLTIQRDVVAEEAP